MSVVLTLIAFAVVGLVLLDLIFREHGLLTRVAAACFVVAAVLRGAELAPTWVSIVLAGVGAAVRIAAKRRDESRRELPTRPTPQ